MSPCQPTAPLHRPLPRATGTGSRTPSGVKHCPRGWHGRRALPLWLNKPGFLWRPAPRSRAARHAGVGAGLAVASELGPSTPKCPHVHNGPSVPHAQKETLSEKASGSVRGAALERHEPPLPVPAGPSALAHCFSCRCCSAVLHPKGSLKKTIFVGTSVHLAVRWGVPAERAPWTAEPGGHPWGGTAGGSSQHPYPAASSKGQQRCCSQGLPLCVAFVVAARAPKCHQPFIYTISWPFWYPLSLQK